MVAKLCNYNFSQEQLFPEKMRFSKNSQTGNTKNEKREKFRLHASYWFLSAHSEEANTTIETPVVSRISLGLLSRTKSLREASYWCIPQCGEQ